MKVWIRFGALLNLCYSSCLADDFSTGKCNVFCYNAGVVHFVTRATLLGGVRIVQLEAVPGT